MDMPAVSRGRALAYAAVALLVLVLAARLLHARSEPPPPAGPHATAVLEAESEPAPQVVVHVVGAVRQPGLYRLDEGSRVDDAIAKAGGATRRAALALVNLAAPVADGQQVVVPSSARGGAATSAAGAAAAPGVSAGRVHLNTATLADLDALPGIGPVTAQRILDYRAQKGAFQTVEELDAVPGIGPARLAQLVELVDL
jgi:competence protein ComEA